MKNTIYCNDHTSHTSTITRIEDIQEVAGITYDEWINKYSSDIEKLNQDLYEFNFSYEPEYEAYAIWENFDHKAHCIVSRAASAEQAWDAAEKFFEEQSDDDVTYCTGLPSADGLTPREDGTYRVRCKAYEKEEE